MSQQRHLQEENAILKKELQRLTSQLVLCSHAWLLGMNWPVNLILQF